VITIKTGQSHHIRFRGHPDSWGVFKKGSRALVRIEKADATTNSHDRIWFTDIENEADGREGIYTLSQSSGALMLSVPPLAVGHSFKDPRTVARAELMHSHINTWYLSFPAGTFGDPIKVSPNRTRLEREAASAERAARLNPEHRAAWPGAAFRQQSQYTQPPQPGEINAKPALLRPIDYEAFRLWQTQINEAVDRGDIRVRVDLVTGHLKLGRWGEL